MATTPDPSERDAHADGLARATDEHSGYTVEGDTPPAEGLGVGPTNPDMDVEKTGEGVNGKLIMGILIALVVVFLLLFVLGRVADLGA
ncbi:hypothetical protein [uncultured Micrococcus sp.]|uniref:hypothetical protein n=1 Tax=uncultured Micrococcus sp. TaxID=114051 RepID=UPI002620ECFC|nr:hypothetical protein [uncultured Micrococcus sp.]